MLPWQQRASCDHALTIKRYFVQNSTVSKCLVQKEYKINFILAAVRQALSCTNCILQSTFNTWAYYESRWIEQLISDLQEFFFIYSVSACKSCSKPRFCGISPAQQLMLDIKWFPFTTWLKAHANMQCSKSGSSRAGSSSSQDWQPLITSEWGQGWGRWRRETDRQTDRQTDRERERERERERDRQTDRQTDKQTEILTEILICSHVLRPVCVLHVLLWKLRLPVYCYLNVRRWAKQKICISTAWWWFSTWRGSGKQKMHVLYGSHIVHHFDFRTDKQCIWCMSVHESGGPFNATKWC